MNIHEMRKTNDYRAAINKIKSYPKGFCFTLCYSQIPKAKANALKVITADCIKEGLIESVSIGLDIEAECVEETFKRI